MNTPFCLETYAQNALAAARARHAANGHDMFAGFHFNGSRYVVEVMQHVVAELRTVAEVRDFCQMHNREF